MQRCMFRELDLSARIFLAETGFACEMNGSEFQEMCTEDVSRWMKDKSVQGCYCEVFQGKLHIYVFAYVAIYVSVHRKTGYQGI